MRFNPVIHGKQRSIHVDDILWSIFIECFDDESEARDFLFECLRDHPKSDLNTWAEIARCYIYGSIRSELRRFKNKQRELFE